MPFEKKSIGFFINVPFNQNGVFILMIYYRQFKILYICRYLFLAVINCLIFLYWFFNYINFKKILFAFFYLFRNFLYHSLISSYILINEYLFRHTHIKVFTFPIISIKNWCRIIRIKHAYDLLFWSEVHLWILLN